MNVAMPLNTLNKVHVLNKLNLMKDNQLQPLWNVVMDGQYDNLDNQQEEFVLHH
jgi:hypothetical protein